MKKDVQTSNIVMVKDKQGNTIYQLQIPVAFDTNGSKVIGSYMLSKSGDGVLVQVNMPYDWFANASRVYPIYIDPTVDTPDGTAEFGTGTPQILVENVTIPAGIPYTITEQIVVDNTTIMDAECECDIINTDTQEKIVDFRSFFNDGFGNMLFTWDEPLLGNYTLSQYCWRGDTLVLNKIYSISIMWVV